MSRRVLGMATKEELLRAGSTGLNYNGSIMRFAIILLAALLQSSLAQLTPEIARCTEKKDGKSCSVSSRELKQAGKEFSRGLQYQRGKKTESAFRAFERASSLVPSDMEYATAREIARQQLVLEQLKRGNELMAEQKNAEAVAAFRHAVQLDPSNNFALQRLQDSAGSASPLRRSALPVVERSDTIEIQPRRERRSFHLRGDARQIIEQVAAAYGLTAYFDESAEPRQLRFDVDDTDFRTAVNLATMMSKTFWTPLSSTQLLVAADRADLRQRFDRMGLRTFYVPDAHTPQELNELVNLFRTIFDVRFVTQNAAAFTITVRAPQRVLEAAIRFFEALDNSRPQIMLEVQVFEVNHSMLRALGLDMPLQWSAFNLTSEALALLGQSNIQSLINQLIASGGINQANSTALSALLAQVQNQQNSLLQQPFATFGGGSTLFAIPWSPTTVNFSLNESRVTSLEHVTLRAAQGNAATLRIGSRFPILNAIFSPIFNTPAIAQVIQTQSFQAPFPSFNYEDLGITVRATPQVHGTKEVTLKLELQIKSLSSQSLNGVPVISNKEYNGGLRIANGESGVVVGMLAESEQDALQGIPGVASIPGLNQIAARHSKQRSATELLVVITPHIVRSAETGQSAIWLPGGAR